MLLFGINKKIISHGKFTLLDFAKNTKEGIESLNPLLGFKVTVERGGYLLFNKIKTELTN